MKKTVYKILFVQMLTLSYGVSFAQIHKPDSVKIEFEGFNTESFVDVTCDAFDSTFLKTKKFKVIHDGRNLLSFESLKKNFKQTKERSFDVRGKITYYYEKGTIKYCFDEFAYFYTDGKFSYNKQLLIAISDSFYSNHPPYLDTLRYE